MPSYYFMKKSEHREYLRCKASGLPFKYPDFVDLDEVYQQYRLLSSPFWSTRNTDSLFRLMCMTGWFALAQEGGGIVEHHHFTTYIEPMMAQDPEWVVFERVYALYLYRKFLLEDYVFGGNG